MVICCLTQLPLESIKKARIPRAYSPNSLTKLTTYSQAGPSSNDYERVVRSGRVTGSLELWYANSLGLGYLD